MGTLLPSKKSSSDGLRSQPSLLTPHVLCKEACDRRPPQPGRAVEVSQSAVK